MQVTFETAADPLALRRALEGFVRVSQGILRDRPELPLLYESGTRYHREPRGRERWQYVDETLRRKEGDCEDLVIARTAELRERFGIEAHPHVYQTQTPGLLHTVVRLPDGSLEDPSIILGMGQNAPERRGRKRATMSGTEPARAKVTITEGPKGYTGSIRFRGENYEVIMNALGSSKVEATERASALSKQIVEAISKSASVDPKYRALAALIPPQAKLAIKVASGLVKVARKGILGKVLGKLKGPTLQLAKALEE